MAYDPDILIKKALSLAKANSRHDREVVYEKLRIILEKQTKSFSQDTIENYQVRLTEAIKKIEDEITISEYSFSSENTRPEYISNPVSQQNDLTDPFKKTVDNNFNFYAKNELDTSKDAKLLTTSNFPVWLLCGLLLAGMTYYFFLNNTSSSLELGSMRKASVIFNSDFKHGIRKFRYLFEESNKKVFLDSKTGVVTAKGQVVFHGKNYIPINKENSYLMRVSFKNSDTNDRKVGAYIGFSTYDEKKQLEIQKPGKHRYFVISNDIPKNRNPDKNGWYSFEGIITGAGNTKNAFRETTKYAKPVVILNFKKPDAISEIRNVEIINIGTFK